MPDSSRFAARPAILLAVGEGGILSALRGALGAQEAGFRLLEASSAPDLLSLLEADPPDALVAHPSLTGGSTAELLELVHGLRPDLPVFVLSSDPGEEARLVSPGGAAGFLSRSDDALARLPTLLDKTMRFDRPQSVARPNEPRAEMLRRTLAVVSHDLRSPLTSLTTLLSMLEGGADGSLTPAQERRVARLRAACDRLTGVVQDLGDLALLASGRAPMQRLPLDLVPLAARVCDELAPVARARLMGLSIRCEAALPRVEADPQWMLRLLRLLIGPALATAEATALEISLAAVEGGVELALREIRSPLPMEALSPEPAPLEAPGSTGAVPAAAPVSAAFALLLAESIVRAHGGSVIRAASGVGSDSALAFFLPALPRHDAAAIDRLRDPRSNA